MSARCVYFLSFYNIIGGWLAAGGDLMKTAQRVLCQHQHATLFAGQLDHWLPPNLMAGFLGRKGQWGAGMHCSEGLQGSFAADKLQVALP